MILSKTNRFDWILMTRIATWLKLSKRILFIDCIEVKMAIYSESQSKKEKSLKTSKCTAKVFQNYFSKHELQIKIVIPSIKKQ